jgi:hypothetical protein
MTAVKLQRLLLKISGAPAWDRVQKFSAEPWRSIDCDVFLLELQRSIGQQSFMEDWKREEGDEVG